MHLTISLRRFLMPFLLPLLLAFGTAARPAAAQATAQAPAPSPVLPTAVPLLGDSLSPFRAYGAGPDTSTLEVVPVEGQPFREALRLTVLKEPVRYYDYGATAPLIAPAHKGDVVWVSLWARRLASRRESGEAQVEVALLQKAGAREIRPLQRRLSVGPKWTAFSLPFLINSDGEPDQTRLAFRYGYGRQRLEIGGIRLLNYGPTVKVTDLPRSLVRYEGWEANAPWRVAAAERIEKYRKGTMTVRVVDAAGTPVSDAAVQVRMKRHAFGWGVAVDEQRVLDTTSPDNARYRAVLETYFNKVVFENDMKWGRWINPKYRQSVLASLPWFAARNIAVRGHVMVWPSWQHSPPFVAEAKNDPAALRRLISEHITDQTNAVDGRLAEWDVINETFAHHDIVDILGRPVMIDWFRQARKGAPHTRLFYNDYTMFQPGPGSQYFYDVVKYLKDGGAPIDAIGEQGHFASNPPGIPEVIATLDKFGGLGLPIQISEFDIDTDDPGLQADFMRDFTTAVFSHHSVMGMLQWGFWAKAHWLPRAALWDSDWKLTPTGQQWVDLTTKTWWTNADGRTAKNGSYTTRGFFGDYEVTVTRGGKSQTVKYALSPSTPSLTVTLP